MTVKTGLKAQAANVKNVGAEEGTFEALVAVFNNVDSYGDVILKGAFADTLTEWDESGFPIPVVWSHDKDDPFSHIGTVTEARETDTGLLVKAQLDLENPKAAQVHRLLKGGRVKEFSFAFSYNPSDVNPTERDGIEVRELKRLKLYEVGPTLVGANPATELVSVKSLDDTNSAGAGDPADDPADDDGQDGDQQAKINELLTTLTNTVNQLADILSSDTEDDDDEYESDGGEASRGQPDTDETPEGKSDPVPAIRSAEDQKNLAALMAAFIEEG